MCRTLSVLRPCVVSCSKFLARNIPLERLLKDYREEFPAPSSSEGDDKERDSCDQLGSADLDLEEDHATQACADSYIKRDPDATAAAVAAVAAQAAAAKAAAAQAQMGPAAAGCEVSPAPGRARCSPTSSTHSEQCGVNNSSGHADALNANNMGYQVSQPASRGLRQWMMCLLPSRIGGSCGHTGALARQLLLRAALLGAATVAAHAGWAHTLPPTSCLPC